MQADPKLLSRRDASSRALVLHWQPRHRHGIDRLSELYEGFCLAADREQRAYILARVVSEIAPSRCPSGLNIAVGRVADRVHGEATGEAVKVFAGYLTKRAEADADKVLLAEGIAADYACDFDRLGFRMDEIDTLADECLDIAAVFGLNP